MQVQSFAGLFLTSRIHSLIIIDISKAKIIDYFDFSLLAHCNISIGHNVDSLKGPSGSYKIKSQNFSVEETEKLKIFQKLRKG